MPLPNLVLLLLANGLLGVVFIPLYIGAARSNNIVDVPNERSSHSVPTPRGGGIFIAAGCLLSIAVAAHFFSTTAPLPWSLLVSGALVAVVGFFDDLKPLPSLLRLGGHFLAAVIFIAGTFITTSDPDANALAPPLLFAALAGLAVWIVGCLNIYNFMDGIDGIATGQGLCAAAVWLVIALLSGDQSCNLTMITAATLAAALLGGLLTFLFFNWSPAKVFMGDGASGFLGFSFAALPLLVADPTPADVWLKLNLGAIALFPFLFDGTYTLFRRAHAILNEDGSFKIGRSSSLISLTEAHRSHLYQRWVQAGASHRKVATAYTAWAALCGGTAVATRLQFISLPIAWLVACIPAAALLWHSRRFSGNQ